MSVENLDKIFQPKSIAVVGASERKGSVGATLMHNLIALAIQKKVTVRELEMLQIATHPLLTSAPTVHPTINAAHQALAKLRVTIRDLPPLKKVA